MVLPIHGVTFNDKGSAWLLGLRQVAGGNHLIDVTRDACDGFQWGLPAGVPILEACSRCCSQQGGLRWCFLVERRDLSLPEGHLFSLQKENLESKRALGGRPLSGACLSWGKQVKVESVKQLWGERRRPGLCACRVLFPIMYLHYLTILSPKHKIVKIWMNKDAVKLQVPLLCPQCAQKQADGNVISAAND